jgi:hypothetical protein
MRKLTHDQFVEKCRKVHNDYYDYSVTKFVDLESNIDISCPKHGVFQQRAAFHRRGNGCKECGKMKIGDNKRWSLDTFISKANETHNYIYDYSKSVYINNDEKVCITCKTHGDFFQTPTNHVRGRGCMKCHLNDKVHDTESCLSKLRVIHGNKYKYPNFSFKSTRTKIDIFCVKHNLVFNQLLSAHLDGQGCSVCKHETISDALSMAPADFFSMCKEVHKDKYNYSQADYITNKIKIKIICNEHGAFYQEPNHHVRGNGCPTCRSAISRWENEVVEFLRSLGDIKIEQRNRKICAGKELDILIPDHNMAIECNGLYWHSELGGGKTSRYHLQKTLACQEQNIQLYQFFEDEWQQKKEIIQSMLKIKLNMVQQKLYARNCSIKSLSIAEKTHFFEENHIQGTANSSICLGLMNNDQIVAAMSFLRNREWEWELNRFCSIKNTIIIGSASKLLHHFKKLHNPNKIMSRANLRWSIGKVYETLDFKLRSEDIHPSYYYTSDYITKTHKSKFAIKKLPKKLIDFDPNLGEWKNMQINHYDRIWDCGVKTYIWTPFS